MIAEEVLIMLTARNLASSVVRAAAREMRQEMSSLSQVATKKSREMAAAISTVSRAEEQLLKANLASTNASMRSMNAYHAAQQSVLAIERKLIVAQNASKDAKNAKINVDNMATKAALGLAAAQDRIAVAFARLAGTGEKASTATRLSREVALSNAYRQEERAMIAVAQAARDLVIARRNVREAGRDVTAARVARGRPSEAASAALAMARSREAQAIVSVTRAEQNLITTGKASQTAAQKDVAISTSIIPIKASVALALAAVGAAAIGMGAKFNIAREETKISIAAISRDAQFAEEAWTKFVQMSKTTRFDVSTLREAAQFMLAMQFNTKQTLPVLKTLVDFTSQFGSRGANMLDRTTLALGQMLSKGVVQSQEMRQLGEANIHAWEYLAKALNVDVAQAMKMVEERSVEGAFAVGAVLRGIQKDTEGLAEKMAKTLPGAWDRFIHTVQASSGEFMEPAYNSLAKFLNKLVDEVQTAEFRLRLAGVQDKAEAVAGALGKVGEITFTQTKRNLVDMGNILGLIAGKAGEFLQKLSDLDMANQKLIRQQEIAAGLRVDDTLTTQAKAQQKYNESIEETERLLDAFHRGEITAAQAGLSRVDITRAQIDAEKELRKVREDLSKIFPTENKPPASVLDKVGAGAKTPERLTLDSFFREMDFARLNQQLNSKGRTLMDNLRQGILDGGTNVIETIAENAIAIEQVLKSTMDPAFAVEAGMQFMDALAFAIADQGPEAVDALRAVLAGIAQESARRTVEIDFGRATRNIYSDAADNIAKVIQDADQQIQDLFDQREIEREIRRVTDVFEEAQDAELKRFEAQQDEARRIFEYAQEEKELKARSAQDMAEYLASVADSGRVDAREMQKRMKEIRRRYFFEREEMVRRRRTAENETKFAKSQTRELEEFRKRQGRERRDFEDRLDEAAFNRQIDRIRREQQERIGDIEQQRDKRIAEERRIADASLLEQQALLTETWEEYQELFDLIEAEDVTIDADLDLPTQAELEAELPDVGLGVSSFTLATGIADPEGGYDISSFTLANDFVLDPEGDYEITSLTRNSGIGDPSGDYDIASLTRQGSIADPVGEYDITAFARATVIDPIGTYDVNRFAQTLDPTGQYDVNWWDDAAAGDPSGAYDITEWDVLAGDPTAVGALSQATRLGALGTDNVGATAIHVHMEGSVFYGLDDLDKKVSESVVRSIRQGGLRLRLINQRRGGSATSGSLGGQSLP